jgi:hypothetical protein
MLLSSVVSQEEGRRPAGSQGAYEIIWVEMQKPKASSLVLENTYVSQRRRYGGYCRSFKLARAAFFFVQSRLSNILSLFSLTTFTLQPMRPLLKGYY